MRDTKPIYIVVDIETDGPAPGLHSMLSMGAVATTGTDELGSFYQKLEPLEEAQADPETMAWWQSQPDAWEEVCRDARPAPTVMKEFLEWLNTFDSDVVFTAHPISFDYTFVSWYLWRFTGKNPFRRSNYLATFDISSFIAGKYDKPLGQSIRQELPMWMQQGMPEHTHNALDDARGYAAILRNILGGKES